MAELTNSEVPPVTKVRTGGYFREQGAKTQTELSAHMLRALKEHVDKEMLLFVECNFILFRQWNIEVKPRYSK